MNNHLEHRVKELEDTVLALYVLLISQTIASDACGAGILETVKSLIIDQQNALAEIGEDGAVRALEQLSGQLHTLAK